MLNNANLLVLSHQYYSFIKDQVEEISAYFRHVDVLVRYKPIAEISSLLPIESFKPHRKRSAIVLAGLPENVRVIPVPLYYLPTDSGYKRLGEKHYRAVRRMITKHDIQADLVHAHFTWSAGYVGARLREEAGIPFVLTAHGYDIYDLPFRDAEWRENIKYVLDRADEVITVSASNLKCVRELGTEKPVHVIPNGVNLKLFYPRESGECRRVLGLPTDRKIVLAVGRLAEIKGQRYLVEAVGQLVSYRHDVICYIVGGGELRKRLDRQAHEAGLQDHVKLVGGRPYHEIPLWMSACDLFVLPSLRESFGVAQVEALACGKPVVATYNGGSESIVTCEDYGYLVEAADPGALCEKILAALDRQWDREHLLSRAEHFSWTSVAERIRRIYEGLLSGPPALRAADTE